MAVIEMLEAIHATGDDGTGFIEAAKSGQAKLMGFGHRVYKNYDPRAKILGKSAVSVLEKIGINDPLLDIARRLERAALEDEYFVQRKLYPNVDFYSGIILKAIGIPVEFFTVMFALGRIPGWMANWKKLRKTPKAVSIDLDKFIPVTTSVTLSKWKNAPSGIQVCFFGIDRFAKNRLRRCLRIRTLRLRNE